MKSTLLKREDTWAIILGLGLLICGLVFFLNTNPSGIENQDLLENQLVEKESTFPFKSIGWYEAFDNLKNIKSSSTQAGKWLKKFTGKPSSWQGNPLKSFYLSEQEAENIGAVNESKYLILRGKTDSLKSIAQRLENEALQQSFANEDKVMEAERAISSWRSSIVEQESLNKKSSVKSYNHFYWLLIFMVFLALIFGIAAHFINGKILLFMLGFGFVFLLGVISYVLAAQSDIKSIGFGYAAWAILLGLIISNTIGTPKWVKPALTTELYIKTGLVVLGAEILLGKILAIGLPGIFVAWVVTPIVLLTTYWFGQKILKIKSKTLNITISADMSVCGVSAAVATAAASKATKEELTIAIGLSMIFTSIMMIVLPAIINILEMPEVLGGAWIGGTIDATGAVVAAGAFLGEKALSVAATIKMIQNVLIGIIAFGVAVYFSRQSDSGVKSKLRWSEIWNRFPKFILGFLGASILFSIVYEFLGENQAYTFIDQGVIGGFSKNIRGWLFCLAFVSIGLSINFKDLRKHFTGGKPLILYICGQLFNLLLTLTIAYLMFYKVFPEITAAI